MRAHRGRRLLYTRPVHRTVVSRNLYQPILHSEQSSTVTVVHDKYLATRALALSEDRVLWTGFTFSENEHMAIPSGYYLPELARRFMHNQQLFTAIKLLIACTIRPLLIYAYQTQNVLCTIRPLLTMSEVSHDRSLHTITTSFHSNRTHIYRAHF